MTSTEAARPVNFIQIISFRCKRTEELVDLERRWDDLHAEYDVTGYMGAHILVDRDDPEQILIIAEFGIVDPTVSAAEEAEKNNERTETNEWLAKFEAITDGPVTYRNFDEIYRTG